MNPLLTAGILYLIAGSARFIRPKLYPDKPNASFNKTFGTLFSMGLLLTALGGLDLLYPSRYAFVALLVILVGGTGYLMNTLDVSRKLDTDTQSDKN